jgi:hypothetical protein
MWKLNTLVSSEEGYHKYVKNYPLEESANHPLRENNVLNWWENILKPGIQRNGFLFYYYLIKLSVLFSPTEDVCKLKKLKEN